MRKSSFSILRWVSFILIFLAVLLTGIQLVSYSRLRSSFPPGMIIAGVPVGGLSQQQAADRLVQAYGIPIELHYGDAVIQVKPSMVGFELDLQGMIAAADLQRITQPFWTSFWDFLWNRLPQPTEIPLRAKLSETRLTTFLREEIAARYDEPPSAPIPIPGTVNFQSGDPGTTLGVDKALIQIDDALRSPSARVVKLSYSRSTPPRPSLQNLEILLRQIIDVAGFEGLTEIYLLDLQTNQELSFAYQRGETITPGIAFTAASLIKVPIMVSVYQRIPEPTPQSIADMIDLMVERSENDPADRLMQRVLDQNLGPLQMTADLKSMGLENTFMAGYFYLGAPLLRRIETPANRRTDINTNPDDYNQTTAIEMGMLMEDIYLCAENSGGTLEAVFQGDVSAQECKAMIDMLSLNRIGVLVQAGLPDGTRVANKHGWTIGYEGYMKSLGDAGIIYTPGGNYIQVIFMHHPVQLIFDPVNRLVANLARATYNYFNMAAE